MTKKVVADKSKMEGMMQDDHNDHSDHSDHSDHNCDAMSDKYKVRYKINIKQLHTNIDHTRRMIKKEKLKIAKGRSVEQGMIMITWCRSERKVQSLWTYKSEY